MPKRFVCPTAECGYVIGTTRLFDIEHSICWLYQLLFFATKNFSQEMRSIGLLFV